MLVKLDRTLYTLTLNFCQVGLFGHEHLLSSLVRKQIDAKLNRDRGKINTIGALQKCWYLCESSDIEKYSKILKSHSINSLQFPRSKILRLGHEVPIPENNA